MKSVSPTHTAIDIYRLNHLAVQQVLSNFTPSRPANVSPIHCYYSFVARVKLCLPLKSFNNNNNNITVVIIVIAAKNVLTSPLLRNTRFYSVNITIYYYLCRIVYVSDSARLCVFVLISSELISS